MAMLNNQRVTDCFSRSRWWDYIRFWVWEVSSINLMRFALKIVTYTSRCSSQIVEGPKHFLSALDSNHSPWPISSELHIFFSSFVPCPNICLFFWCVAFSFGDIRTNDWTPNSNPQMNWWLHWRRMLVFIGFHHDWTWLNDVSLLKKKHSFKFQHMFHSWFHESLTSPSGNFT